MPPDLTAMTTLQFENVESVHIHSDSLHISHRPSERQRTDTRLETNGNVALMIKNGRLVVRF